MRDNHFWSISRRGPVIRAPPAGYRLTYVRRLTDVPCAAAAAAAAAAGLVEVAPPPQKTETT